ncbi:carboxyl transferase domain-containing protein [Janibacter sp. G1551]|uniref:carboxyl transferase domain-containing protein n=1 Tax=Janibacter sp. G1551 TaxID=3420440 RepID=UPI003D08B720
MTTDTAAAVRGHAPGAVPTPEEVWAPEVIERWDTDLHSLDPLDFEGYAVPDAADESVTTARIRLGDTEAVWIDCDFRRQGGTMGSVAGERIVRALDSATALGLPVVETVSSGGARLQEGMVSLLQMARTSSAVARHAAAGLQSAAYLRSPCTGGVFASWASLADLRAAEPGATIGFGGPRVVAQVTGEFPPATSHTAESAFAAGLVDAIVPPEQQWAWLAAAIGALPAPALALGPGRASAPDTTPVPADPYEVLLRCRAAGRASGMEWATWLSDSWVEIKGSDPAVRAGLADFDGRRVVVVAMDRHAGSRPKHLPSPAAFRLAQRAIRLAGRLGLPLLTIIDTLGADPSPASETDAIAGDIARTLLAMAQCPSPSVALTVGEGGSGGAVALAHADRHLVLEGGVFSVIGPEAGAVILHRDAARAPELAARFRMTADELRSLGAVDAVLPEEVGAVRRAVLAALDEAVPGDRDRRIDELTARSVSAD